MSFWYTYCNFSTHPLHIPIFRLKILLGNEKCYQCVSVTHTNDVKLSNGLEPLLKPTLYIPTSYSQKELSLIYLLINLYCFPTTYPGIKGPSQHHLLTSLYQKFLALKTGLTCCFSTMYFPFGSLCLGGLIPSPLGEEIPSLLQGLPHAKSLQQNIFPKMNTRCSIPHVLFTM